METPERVLTATEGADRVEERWRKRRAGARAEAVAASAEKEVEDLEGNKNEETPIYRCESCGGQTFCMTHSFVEEKVINETLACKCPDPLQETAATRVILIRHVNEWRGTLGNDHRVEREDKDYDEEREEQDKVVHCAKCFRQASDDDWEGEDGGEFVEVEEDEYWEVNCADCGHEIEFGWSHPDRGGRIWPCEAVDFNPWMSFPEERFTEAWQKRGWLRPLKQDPARGGAAQP